MTTWAENELMTRLDDDAPMGRLMRGNYWIPFGLSAHLVSGEAPTPVRLFGENYVAFRAEDGRIGFFDELCPHRRASLALARIEGNGVRCIYHGWKIDVSGCVVEAPLRSPGPEQFAASVPVVHFPVHESGGLAWVWLGGGDAPPPFPDLPFGDDEPLPLLVRVAGPLQLAAGRRGHDRLGPRRACSTRPGSPRQPRWPSTPTSASLSPSCRRYETAVDLVRHAGGGAAQDRPTVAPTCASPST